MARSEKTRKNPVEDLLREKRGEILRIAEKHGARNVRVFGSVVHGEATETSDIDLLVDTSEETSPWFPAGLVEELEEILGKRVDVVSLWREGTGLSPSRASTKGGEGEVNVGVSGAGLG